MLRSAQSESHVITKTEELPWTAEIVLPNGKINSIIPASNPVFKWILQLRLIQLTGNPMWHKFKLFKLLEQQMDMLPNVLVGLISYLPRPENMRNTIGYISRICPQVHADLKVNLPLNGAPCRHQFCPVARLVEPWHVSHRNYLASSRIHAPPCRQLSRLCCRSGRTISEDVLDPC